MPRAWGCARVHGGMGNDILTLANLCDKHVTCGSGMCDESLIYLFIISTTSRTWSFIKPKCFSSIVDTDNKFRGSSCPWVVMSHTRNWITNEHSTYLTTLHFWREIWTYPRHFSFLSKRYKIRVFSHTRVRTLKPGKHHQVKTKHTTKILSIA